MLCIERLFGLACQGNEGSVHPFTLHTAMPQHPAQLAGWLAYLEGSAEQPFSAGSVPASARVVPDQRGAGEPQTQLSIPLGEQEPALSAGIQVSISITCNQIRCSAGLHTYHKVQKSKKKDGLFFRFDLICIIQPLNLQHKWQAHHRERSLQKCSDLTFAACIVYTVCQMKRLWQVKKTTNSLTCAIPICPC